MISDLAENTMLIPVRISVDHRYRGDGYVKIQVMSDHDVSQKLHAEAGLDLTGVSQSRIEAFIKNPLDAVAYTGTFAPELFGRDE